MTDDADDDFQLTDTVTAAAKGDQVAWVEIVGRFSPLLVSVIRGYRLTASETEDIAQEVWLRLVEHLDSLREPRALPKWIITTARREALRHLNVHRQRRTHSRDPLEPNWLAVAGGGADPDENLLRAERRDALLAGLAELPTRQREVLLLLIVDPPLSYAEISHRLGLPPGGIGPTRARALDRLRKTPSIRTYRDDSDLLDHAGGDRRDAATLG
jgi:RNA polymerase sigma factor (sigma-70 family)